MNPLYDVAIIGGGPAGSTAATFLSRKGRKVIVLEKEKYVIDCSGRNTVMGNFFQSQKSLSEPEEIRGLRALRKCRPRRGAGGHLYPAGARRRPLAARGLHRPDVQYRRFVAMESAENAAHTIDAALATPRRRAALFKKYEREMNRVMDLYLRFVSNWYKPRFIEVITHPVDRFQPVSVINSMLAGNIGRSFTLWSRMEAFYLVTFLQRYFPLCPRIPYLPQKEKM